MTEETLKRHKEVARKELKKMTADFEKTGWYDNEYPDLKAMKEAIIK